MYITYTQVTVRINIELTDVGAFIFHRRLGVLAILEDGIKTVLPF
jgi:hypothetical protein